MAYGQNASSCVPLTLCLRQLCYHLFSQNSLIPICNKLENNPLLGYISILLNEFTSLVLRKPPGQPSSFILYTGQITSAVGTTKTLCTEENNDKCSFTMAWDLLNYISCQVTNLYLIQLYHYLFELEFPFSHLK